MSISQWLGNTPRVKSHGMWLPAIGVEEISRSMEEAMWAMYLKCTTALRRSVSCDLLDWARSMVCHLCVFAGILTRGLLNRASLVSIYCNIILSRDGVSWYYEIIAFQRAGHRFISNKCGVGVIQSRSVIHRFWCARVRRVNNFMGFARGI